MTKRHAKRVLFGVRLFLGFVVFLAVLFAVAWVVDLGDSGIRFYGVGDGPIGLQIADEAGFRSAMSTYGMKRSDVDCMVDVLAKMDYPLRETTNLTGTLLNDVAQQCGVNTSKLRGPRPED
jgi:hypothetical protein